MSASKRQLILVVLASLVAAVAPAMAAAVSLRFYGNGVNAPYCKRSPASGPVKGLICTGP